jgi:hypothetical protein
MSNLLSHKPFYVIKRLLRWSIAQQPPNLQPLQKGRNPNYHKNLQYSSEASIRVEMPIPPLIRLPPRDFPTIQDACAPTRYDQSTIRALLRYMQLPCGQTQGNCM